MVNPAKMAKDKGSYVKALDALRANFYSRAGVIRPRLGYVVNAEDKKNLQTVLESGQFTYKEDSTST